MQGGGEQPPGKPVEGRGGEQPPGKPVEGGGEQSPGELVEGGGGNGKYLKVDWDLCYLQNIILQRHLSPRIHSNFSYK